MAQRATLPLSAGEQLRQLARVVHGFVAVAVIHEQMDLFGRSPSAGSRVAFLRARSLIGVVEALGASAWFSVAALRPMESTRERGGPRRPGGGSREARGSSTASQSALVARDARVSSRFRSSIQRACGTRAAGRREGVARADDLALLLHESEPSGYGEDRAELSPLASAARVHPNRAGSRRYLFSQSW